MPSSSYTVHPVQHPDQFPAVEESLRQARRIGLDTEFMREGRYFPKLCLVQLVAGRDIWLIDPLAAGEPEFLWPLLLRDDLEIVMHSGFQDMEILHFRTNRLPAHIVDVQILAGFAGFGHSLAYHALVHAVTGAHLHKGATFTMWDKRPLTREQLEYAADDVRYLFPIADRLQDRLKSLAAKDARRLPGFDRIACVADEVRWQYRRERMVFDPVEELQSMGRTASRMTGAQRTLLCELIRWRERAARNADRPLNSVAKLETISTLARHPPASLGDLAHSRGLAIFRDKAAQQDLLATVEKAKALPPTPWVRTDREEELPASCSALLDFFAAALHLWADEVEIAPELLARTKDIGAWLVDRTLEATPAPSAAGPDPALADGASPAKKSRERQGRSRLSQGWRKQVVGELLDKLLAGQLVLTPSLSGPDGWPTLSLKPL